MIIGPGLRAPQPPPQSPPALHAARIYTSGAWVVAELSGEIDSAAERSVGRALVDALGPGRGDLLVDLSLVRFLDSSGFRALIRARERAVDLGGRMRIVCPDGPVRLSLRVLNAVERLPVLPDLESAADGGRA
ncbi:MAG TPA: STAS domain-containing protein [Actinocrinis sp.]|nr:STAS domain-containing protein [Actinocrinis sp.]